MEYASKKALINDDAFSKALVVGNETGEPAGDSVDRYRDALLLWGMNPAVAVDEAEQKYVSIVAHHACNNSKEWFLVLPLRKVSNEGLPNIDCFGVHVHSLL